jgi:aminopeptidase N
VPSLTRAEAAQRAETVRVRAYEIDLDLTRGSERFGSTTTVRFSAAAPETFIEVRPARLVAARLNGVALDPADLRDNRLVVRGLRDENELVVEAEMAYSNTGEGLHRFVDPADGRVYLYAMSFLDEAQRIFACFDQPDLKAPVTLAVTADPEWTVLGNAPLAGSGDGRWVFEPTPPLPTYAVTLVAGPYHTVRGEHDGIPLGLHCRASLARHLDRDATDLLALTQACFDRFHDLFDFRYPFGKYDQAFVPEFNAGAMENPGLVTLRDDYVFRSAVTAAQRERRATTIAHEMAHMWFGDLVTMRWWDDLWLNESFAEYLGVRVVAECGYPGAWTTFAVRDKAWGYAADQRPSSHPVAPADVPDAAQALLHFDGISYAKGAAALRQLAAWVGDRAFLAGLREYVAAHAYGNATLADLLHRLAAASGRDLDAWATAWLRTSGVDTLIPVLDVDPDGRYASVAVERTSPAVPRPHRIGVGLYDAGARRRRVEVDVGVADGRVQVPALAGEPAADLLLLNDGDLTYAKVRLDVRAWERLPALLPTVEDPLTRALLWLAVWDAVRDAERPASDFITLVRAALPTEAEVGIVEQVLGQARDLADRYLAPPGRPAALGAIAEACDRVLASAEPGGSHQLAAARGLISATTDPDPLLAWRDGAVPSGLALDAELRWRILYRLVVLGAAGPDAVDAELAADRTAAGREWAARCQAAVPSPDAKARAWRTITEDLSVSNRIVLATAEGFWQPEQAELCAPYVERYFAELPVVATRRTAMVLERLAEAAFPRFAVTERTREAAWALLARDDLDPTVRRAVTDGDDELGRALAARTRMT